MVQAPSGELDVVRTIGCMVHKSLAYEEMLLLKAVLNIPLSGGILRIKMIEKMGEN
jgi:hypothetical protein